MDTSQRASHPSREQIETLLAFLEQNQSVARGFSRVPSGRDTTRRLWEQITVTLNSLGGCVKNSKQWTNIGQIKKVPQKKGALRYRTRNQTGGGAGVVELSEVEERILALMGGEGFAVGDKHLEINPFEEMQVDNGTNHSLLANIPFQTEPQFTPEQYSTPNMRNNIPLLEEQQIHVECVAGTSHASTRPSVVYEVPLVSMPTPCTPPQVHIASPEMPATPSGSGSHPESNVRRRLTPPPQFQSFARTTSSRGRRRRRLSPPAASLGCIL